MAWPSYEKGTDGVLFNSRVQRQHTARAVLPENPAAESWKATKGNQENDDNTGSRIQIKSSNDNDDDYDSEIDPQRGHTKSGLIAR